MDLSIHSVRIHRLELPTARPHRVNSHAIQARRVLLVGVRLHGGAEGWGEASPPGGPWWNGESVDTCASILSSHLAPHVVGTSVDETAGTMARLRHRVRGNPFAYAALETGMLDAWSRSLRTPLVTLLGGRHRSELPLRWALGAEPPEVVGDEIEQMKERGFRSFKLKMGAVRPEEDLRRVAAIADRLGSEASICVDNNGCWDEATARWMVHELEALGVDWIEQPVAGPRHDSMARLRGRLVRARLLADESVQSPEDAATVAAHGAADAISVKPGKSGGLLRAKEVAALGQAFGLQGYGGTALESSIGTAASLHLFASIPTVTECELVGTALLAEDITSAPVLPTAGSLRLPDGPGLGLGVEVNEATLERFELSKTVVGPN